MTNTAYEDLLFDIQKNFEEKDAQIVELLPSEDQIFDINLNDRTIDIPQYLSVQYDHNAEIICFRCARYLDSMDLTKTVCIVEYINANGDPGLYWVPHYDTSHYVYDEENPDAETPVILIPWAVNGLATAAAGKITFTVRFYKLSADGKRFLFNMSTRPIEGEILHGMELTEEDLKDFELDPDAIAHLVVQINNANEYAITYWTDL